MRRIAVLTGGGDAPGLNAVIRAVVKTATLQYDCEVLGVQDGFDGFVTPDGVIPLPASAVHGILPRGGTILGTANRGNPFARKVFVDGVEVVEDISAMIIDRIRSLKLDCLIVIGGDGTLRIAQELFEIGVPVVGVPKTIDNDIGGTEISFGFDTALNTATDALDRLHTTAEAHHRVMVLELMGRDAGFITLNAGLSGGADVILIPEIPFRMQSVCGKILQRRDSGTKFSIVAVSEGAKPLDGEQIYAIQGDNVTYARLGGMGDFVTQQIWKMTGIETRLTVLGHLQRGGSPSAFDRWLATRYGAAAVRLAMSGGTGRMVSLQNGVIRDVTIKEAISRPKRVYLDGDAILTARNIGICLGD
jgi:ATP-dependent phosphofructokinase / diphosphate-dependent phosphofructokinase